MEEDDSSNLVENMKQLNLAMTQLKTLIGKMGPSEKLEMKWWLDAVEKNESNVGEVTNKFHKAMKKRIFGGRTTVNREVCASRHTVLQLISRGKEISDTIEGFVSEVETEKLFRYSHKQIKRICEPITIIGSGEFGLVYKAKSSEGVPLAVKVLFAGLEIDDLQKQFIAEVGTMRKTYHRNLVRLHGYCVDAELIAFVYEYMEGSLEEILAGDPYDVSWSQLYGVAKGTARALSYLHEHCDPIIIHRDIKLGNVLLDANYAPKITDFGLARLYSMKESKAATTILKRAHSYDAPELLEGKVLNYKCDVYSYGMMLFDVLRRKNGDEKKIFAKRVWDKFMKNELDQIIEECGIGDEDKESATKLSKIALWCINDSSNKRPNMSTVLKVLEGEIDDPTREYLLSLSSAT